jgi:hypothetical protein
MAAYYPYGYMPMMDPATVMSMHGMYSTMDAASMAQQMAAMTTSASVAGASVIFVSYHIVLMDMLPLPLQLH